jgi:uncharacterized membrane protein YtjA (UPF0391 family)
MLRWSLIFLIVAIVAAANAEGIARILFGIFLVLFVASLFIGLMTGRGPPMGPTV